MKRKKFINLMTLGTGSLMVLPSISLLQSCQYKPIVRLNISEKDVPFLDEIAETIIPTTETSPGAKAAGVGAYMVVMYKDCMKAEDQITLVNGLNALDARAAETLGGSFIEAEATQKLQLLETIQAEAHAFNQEQKGSEQPQRHYFDILRGLTTSGYFSSEIGMTQARRYNPVPGSYQGCIPFNPGDKVWA